MLNRLSRAEVIIRHTTQNIVDGTEAAAPLVEDLSIELRNDHGQRFAVLELSFADPVNAVSTSGITPSFQVQLNLAREIARRINGTEIPL